MLPDKLDLYFDGSCGPSNPGGTAGYAWRLVDPNTGKVLAQDCGEVCRGPTATNNIGEWGAVKAGLEHLAEKGWKGELNIRGDSQLVIYQLIGKYKCRKETLIPFYDACMLILEGLTWDAHWIPREQNDECDRMSKQAYTGGRGAADIRRTVSGLQGVSPDHGGIRSDVGGPGKKSRRTRAAQRDGLGQAQPLPGEETPEVAFD